MARKSGNTTWHAAALQLQADGQSAAKIAESLKDTPEHPSVDAVKKFLTRAKKDPGKALQTMTNARGFQAPRVKLSPEQNDALADLIIGTQKNMTVVINDGLTAIDAYLTLSPTEKHDPEAIKLMERQAFFAQGILMPLMAAASGVLEGGAGPAGGKKGKDDPEETHRRAIERLDELADPDQ